jgi:signal transduction histidine kinase/DNA-binding response OmpR family regulator
MLQSLFTIVMVIDRNLTVVYASDILVKHLPVVTGQPRLPQVFDFLRPRTITTFDQAKSHSESLFLLVATDKSFSVRGQVISWVYDGQEHLVFCGSPWLSWMETNCPELKFSLKDFSPQDSQLDQLFYMTTEKRMVNDLEQLNAELHLAKDRAEVARMEKTAFFSQMSHEMRTPLNGVVAALALMKEQGLRGKAGELVDLASKSSGNLMQVINYILDISKLEYSEPQPAQLEFELTDLIDSVADIVRARALEKGLELNIRIDNRLPTSYLGDAARLRQALLNVMINAIKFTEEGSVTVLAVPASEENQTLRIEVKDTGVGIEKQYQSSIFEPFETVTPIGSAPVLKGTGLGLDIARQNIKSMNGHIGVLSIPGKGATFWIELPCPTITKSPASPSERSVMIEQNELLKGRVLLVDDNETNLLLGKMILERLGVTVTPASSGEEAVKIATASDLDLVLMDISMPGIDGFEATRQIRAILDSQTLPVVALTAYASSAELVKSEACGMNGYLTKPIEQESLVTTLAAWLPRQEEEAIEHSRKVVPDGKQDQVDRAVIDNLLRQIGRENLESVITKFCDEADRRWLALERAQDDDELAREAHTLASTCRSFGLPAVADKLNSIERYAKFDAGRGEEPFCTLDAGQQLTAGLVELKEAIAKL